MNKTLHLKVKSIRKQRGLSIAALAQISGLSRPTIYSYDSDELGGFRRQVLEDLAAALNVSPLDLFEVRNPEPVTSSHSG